MNNEENSENNSSPDFTDSTINLPAGNLADEIDEEEDEFSPPDTEENEAKEPNIGAIIGVIFIIFIFILMILMFAGSRKKKNDKRRELDKAGTKFEVEFKEKSPQAFVENIEESNSKKNEEEIIYTDENIDDILETLPTELQPNPQPAPTRAPVTAAGGGSYKSDRPDTRNSKSPRKIEGLAGQAPVQTNQNVVNALLNGNYSPTTSNSQSMTKEEYIANMMKETQKIQNQMYGGTSSSSGYGSYGSGSQAAAYQQNKEQFYANGSGQAGSGQFMSYNSLWDGTIISGALVTAINTDNPGVVIARVTENVYSSYDHSFLLIPEGSLLYATYNSSVSYGQNKVQVAWNLLIRPDGYRITLGNMNGVSAQGTSGYKGHVNNHPWETLKALGMIAIYSMIQTEATNDIKAENNEYLKNAMTDVYAQTTKIGNKIIDRALDIKPTITIKSGTEIKLITNTPLELPPVQINQVTRKYIRTR